MSAVRLQVQEYKSGNKVGSEYELGSEGASIRALMQERDSVDSGGVTLLVSARV